MKGDNVAAVMVTANLPPFSRPGNRIDINVSSIGDADNLRGGTLIVTPLKGADGEVYAVAQGSIQVSGFSAGGDASSVTQGVPTAGRIPNGGIVEKEIAYSMIEKKKSSCPYAALISQPLVVLQRLLIRKWAHRQPWPWTPQPFWLSNPKAIKAIWST